MPPSTSNTNGTRRRRGEIPSSSSNTNEKTRREGVFPFPPCFFHPICVCVFQTRPNASKCVKKRLKSQKFSINGKKFEVTYYFGGMAVLAHPSLFSRVHSTSKRVQTRENRLKSRTFSIKLSKSRNKIPFWRDGYYSPSPLCSLSITMVGFPKPCHCLSSIHAVHDGEWWWGS